MGSSWSKLFHSIFTTVVLAEIWWQAAGYGNDGFPPSGNDVANLIVAWAIGAYLENRINREV